MTEKSDVPALSDEESPETEADLWEQIEASEAGGDKPVEKDEAVDSQSAQEESQPADAVDQPADEGGDSKPADIWATMPEEVRNEHERLQNQFRRETQRTSALQRKINELTAAMSAKAAPDASQKPAPPEANSGDSGKSSDDELKRLKEEYPEIATPLLRKLSQLEGTAKSLELAEQQRQEAYIAQQEESLSEAVPDWKEMLSRNGERFLTWIEDQPRAVRDAAKLNATVIVDAQAAAEVMGRFKDFLAGSQPQAPSGETQSAKPDKRQRQLAAAAAPRARSQSRIATGIPEDGDPKDIWDAYERAERQAGA